MEDPVKEIGGIIHALVTSAPDEQRRTIETYFTPTASFIHPFCRTGSFDGSRWLIIQIYRWYKILSPRIDLWVDSVSFDQPKNLLYVSIRQKFRLWVIPGHLADVHLTTVLTLTQDSKTIRDAIKGNSNSTIEGHADPLLAPRKKYYIQQQNDLYQVNEFIKFLVPYGIGDTLVILWQLQATLLCCVGVVLFWPLTWLEQNVIGGNAQRTPLKAVLGADRD